MLDFVLHNEVLFMLKALDVVNTFVYHAQRNSDMFQVNEIGDKFFSQLNVTA